jgi:hypothetical protein
VSDAQYTTLFTMLTLVSGLLGWVAHGVHNLQTICVP